MKKTFKSYIGVWLICLLTFNIIAFIVPNEMKTNFWVGYIFITLAFVGQLFCTSISFKSENAQKFFYNFPLISISFVGTVIMLIAAGLTTAISAIPVWVGIVFCLIILAFTAIAIINASVVSETASNIDEKVKSKTLFIKMLTADASTLMSKAQTKKAKEITKKVYEIIRYSDPVSNDALSAIESQITVRFKEFESAICENSEKATSLGEELIILIEDRNTKCKLLK
jgi:hypothetical protein